MPLPQHVRDELVRKRAAEDRQASRDALWANVRAALLCVAWSLLGLACMALGLHTSDPDLGQIFWKGGMVVGYSGILVTLVRWNNRRRERGDA